MESAGNSVAPAKSAHANDRYRMSEHRPGPNANPVYRAGQVTGEFVRDKPAASLLLGFGIGYAAGMLLMRPGNLSSTPESRFRDAYDPENLY